MLKPIGPEGPLSSLLSPLSSLFLSIYPACKCQIKLLPIFVISPLSPVRYRTWYQSAEEKYSPRVCPATPPPSSAAASFCAARRHPAVTLPGHRARPTALCICVSPCRRAVPATSPCPGRRPAWRSLRTTSTIPATPSCPCDAAALKRRCYPAVALPGGRPAWPPRAPYRLCRRAAPSSVVPTDVALQRPGSSCPACCHPITALPAAALLSPYHRRCPANCHRPARRSPCSITAPPSSCSRYHPAVALPSRRPADIAWLLSPWCITRPPCYRRAPLPCHWGSLLLRLTCLAVSTHIPWPPVRLHNC